MASPPPPYANITGISRSVMKDNAQESLVNYDGHARPGELVLNLETDPPALYVGNNLGQLTLVSTGGGGASNKIYNGTSSANIATADGNLIININSNSWTFGTDGMLQLPSGQYKGLSWPNGAAVFADDDNALNIGNFDPAFSNTNVQIITNVAGSERNWVFGSDGELYTPQGGRLGVAGKGWTGLDGGNGNPVSVTSYYANGFYAGCFSAYSDGNVSISTYTGSNNYSWNFDNTGNLSVPGNIITSGLSGNITGANVISANEFSSAGNTTVGNLLTFANLAVSGGDPLTATDTTIAFKIPVTINGNVYYLSLTAAQ